jgi:methylmalonyl-CoA mutase, N-terminal domain
MFDERGRGVRQVEGAWYRRLKALSRRGPTIVGPDRLWYLWFPAIRPVLRPAHKVKNPGQRPPRRPSGSSSEDKRWEDETLDPARKRHADRLEEFPDSTGAPFQPLYTPADVTANYAEDIGYPGEYPFTRGIHPSMYRSRLWTMRQYAGFGTAKETNRRFRALLDRGQTGLSVAFDLPTQMGYDSDHPLAEGEVGRAGVAIDSLLDMEQLLDGIDLEKVSTSMTINATAAILLSLYVAVARRKGADLSRLSGTVQNDILKEYIARGTYIYPPAPSLRIVTDLFHYCQEHLPAWNVISISGYHIREAGSTASQEVAFTLANAVAYLEAARNAGIEVDRIARRISFFFNAHNVFLEEVAKFRAARRLWARLLKERFGVTDPRSLMLRFHTQTGGSTLTAQQPENNVVRVAVQALAAVLGGTQSLHTNSRDEALSLPTETAAVTALRTQQVLAHESGVADVVDPLAGSYLVESLTDKLEGDAREYLERIDSMGGAIAAIEQGYVQREIADAAYEAQKRIESGDQVVVGVNRFQEGGEAKIPLHRIDEKAVAGQREGLTKVRAGRDAGKVSATLDAVDDAARGSSNLIPRILDAVEAMATLGEISDTMRREFGEYRDAG